MTKLKIPDFKSLDEAADYWDTHSFADYFEDTEPVEIEVRLAKRKILLEIDRDLSEKLKKIAQKKRQSYDKLINSWVREKIMQEASN
ncbi:CopG antitoxin of type II toxin-antitoxin system [uncultured archaeon]|nr:CopG antitoxin of type II toxin-antitoxin system [uncultured archaeon]